MSEKITSITIRYQVSSGNLFNEGGYDENASLDNYCDLLEQRWNELAKEYFPEADIDISINRQYGCQGYTGPIQIDLENDEGEPVFNTDGYESLFLTESEKVFEKGGWEVSHKRCVINDLDGDTFHTVFSGSLEEAKEEYSDHPVLKDLIVQAENTGEATTSFNLDGESYTTKVIVS